MKRKLQRITNLLITIIFIFTQTITPVMSAYAPCQTDLQVVETIEQTVSPETEAVVVLEEAKLEIPIGAVTEPVEIKIEKFQQVAELNPGLDNVTDGAVGYRFKPDGQQFTQPVKVTLPYDKRLVAGEGRLTDPYTYFYNTESKHWERLERVAIDEDKGLITSLTTHFTDMINGVLTLPDTPLPLSFNPTSIKEIKAADPGTGINLIQEPQAGPGGSAALTYPLEVPPGRAGLQAEVNLGYNSDGGNGWLGEGWDLPMRSVTIDTRWGVPRYDQDYETETYLLEGMQLTPLAHRGELNPRRPEMVFRSRVEGDFKQIIRHGEGPADYWWGVTDKNGVEYYYGGKPGNGTLPAAVLADPATGNIFTWALVQVRDPHGNTVDYEYAQVVDSGVGQGYSAAPGRQLYLKTIRYTGFEDESGPYSVNFLRDRDLRAAGADEPRRKDVIITARSGFKVVTADLLRKVEVKYGDQPVRSYEFVYKEGAFGKSLLEYIIQYGADGEEFNRHQFAYYDEVTGEDGYRGFETGQEITAGYDNLRENLTVDEVKLSALGGSVSSTKNWHMYTGLGLGSKRRSAGYKVGGSDTDTETLVSLVDLNGDGLPDKVFKKGGSVYYRPNISRPGAEPAFSNTAQVVPGLNSISLESAKTESSGAEAYIGFGNALYNDAETVTTGEVYFSDVNGDGLVDLVDRGTVLFNRLVNGVPTFIPGDTGGTPVPIEDGMVDEEIYLDLQDLYQKMLDNAPLMDAVRVWRAPFSGEIQIQAPVRLLPPVDPKAKDLDGVQVAVQHNSSELWAAEIPAGDYGTKHPVGLNSITVKRGDLFYFRVGSVHNGAEDRVTWDPQIKYVDFPEDLVDVNGFQPYVYQASTDFVRAGRGREIIAPFTGTLQITGVLEKTAVTTDQVRLVVYKNDQEVYSQELNWNEIASLPVDFSLPVEFKNEEEYDRLQIKLESDSPIDVRSIHWAPEIYYTKTADPDLPLFDQEGNPLLKLDAFYDIDLYSLIKVDGSWTAPRNGSFRIVPQPSVSTNPQLNATLYFTVKKKNELIRKVAIPIRNGQYSVGNGLLIEATKDEEFYFSFSSRDPQLSNRVSAGSVKIENPNNPMNPWTAPAGFHCTEIPRPNSLPLAFRCWGYLAYNGNKERARQPIKENELIIDEEYGQGSFAPVFLLFPDKAPNGDTWRWASEDDGCWIEAGMMSSSRRGTDQINLPGSGRAAGARGVIRTSRADQYTKGAGVSKASISEAKGSSYSMLDFMDLNGDRFPDIISNGKVQYTTMTGALGESRNFARTYRQSENYALVAGVGGNPPLMIVNSRGEVENSLSGKSGTLMSTLGLTLNLEDDKWSKSRAELIDMNGDDLLDLVTCSGSTLQVALNLGYGFAAAEVWGSGFISEGRSQNPPVSGSLGLGYNTGEYGFAGGASYNSTRSWEGKSLTDINGDGLPDLVSKEGNYLYVNVNTGAGFDQKVRWGQALSGQELSSTKSYSFGAGAYMTWTINILFTPISIIINPGGDASKSAGRRESALLDINGDGLPDHVASASDERMSVALNRAGVTNKLKSVKRPLGAEFELEYALVGNTYDLPQSKWVMSKLTVRDGHSGDGVDTQTLIFEYKNGKYDRLERDFYGFGQVATKMLDENEEVYRQVIRTFKNDSFYTKMRPERELVTDGTGRKYTENVNHYRLLDVETQTELIEVYPYTATATVFPQLTKVESFFYEGEETAGMMTYQIFEYDAYGNVTRYFDAGDPGAEDDVETAAVYEYLIEEYIMNRPREFTVASNGRVLRHRMGHYDRATGDLLQLEEEVENGRIRVTNLEYEANGNIKRVTGPANERGQRYTVDFTYDQEVFTYITAITDSFGYQSTAAYDYRYGVETVTVDLNGNVMRKDYDDFGRLRRVFGPYDQLFPAVDFTYYHTELPARAVTKNKVHFDPDNAETLVTVLFIDGLKRVIQTKKEGEVQATGALGSSYGMNVTGKVSFDAFGRLVEQGQPVFIRGYDEQWADVAMKNPTRTEYDVLDRTTHVALPDGSVIRTEYAIVDNCFVQTVTDPEGKVKKSGQDVRGNVVRTVQYKAGEAIETTYKYNPLSEIVEITDAQGNVTTVTYDLLGQRKQINHPDRGLVEYFYDSAGNLVRKVDGNLRQKGQAIKYIYDYNRLQKIDYPESKDIEYEYGGPGAPHNRAGRVAKVTDTPGTTEYYYGKLGEEIKNVRSIKYLNTGLGTWTYQSEYQYDYLGRIESMTYPDGETLTYTYDQGGQVKAVSGVKFNDYYVYIKDIRYDEFGQRAYIKYGNNTETTYTYDPHRRWLENIETKNNFGVKFQDTTYNFDRVGNVLGYENTALNVRQTYAYDDLYQLIRAEGTAPVQNNSQIGRYTQSFDYDILGNMTKKQSNCWIGSWPVQDLTYKFTYHYNGSKPHAPNQVGNWDCYYDANGNLVERARRLGQNAIPEEDTVNLGPVDEYQWDEENRLIRTRVRGEITAYTYDAGGNRTNKNNPHGETVYVSEFFQLQHNHTGTKHIYVGNGRLAVKLMRYRQPNNPYECNFSNQTIHDNDYERKSFYVLHTDHLGSTNVVTDYEGKMFQHLEYMPYGESWIEEGVWNDFLRVKFTGKEHDPETNMYYYGARYLDPLFSRWVSTDPAFEEYLPIPPIDDEAKRYNSQLPGQGGVFNQVNLAVYQYSANNPMKYVDPNGEIVGTAIGAFSGGIIGGFSAWRQGKDIKTGIMSGAVSGAIAGAAVDIAVATGGTGLVIIGAAAAGGGVGSFTGELIDQVGTRIAGGQSLNMAVKNLDYGRAGVSATIGVITGAIGGTTSVALDRVMQSSQGVIRVTMDHLGDTLRQVIGQNAPKAVVDDIIKNAISTCHQAATSASNSVVTIEVGTTVVYTMLNIDLNERLNK